MGQFNDCLVILDAYSGVKQLFFSLGVLAICGMNKRTIPNAKINFRNGERKLNQRG
ncbi:hypothetical protein Cflav_PD0653 [Pedosphaera parvula Ellin514]|uniref:Uncharacterized protein n=1 Tax=Pedosphaera parvula (strain Ellin514) TaxID=320771 RepID=B9XQZ4_PEDPL|nr:hypothetical protein Cflav_PD0653 [Pedosphaera parvula Ellin514]